MKNLLLVLAENQIRLKKQNDRLFEMMRSKNKCQNEELDNLWKQKYYELKR